MAFQTLAHGADPFSVSSLEAYPAGLPKPLVTAILNDPEMEREGRTTAILVHGFIYTHDASGATIVVPEGFITDFASIPKAVRFAYPPFGRHAKAAVLHDWLYAVGEPGRKKYADRIFFDAMTELEVDDAKRDVMFEAVSLFGHKGYANAARDWPKSWGDWKDGEYLALPLYAREDFFVSKWPSPPRPGFEV